MRLGRAPCPVCDDSSGEDVPVASGCAVDDDAAPRGDSSFGTSSGQYQPGIAWNPDEEDISLARIGGYEAQRLKSSITRLPTEAR